MDQSPDTPARGARVALRRTAAAAATCVLLLTSGAIAHAQPQAPTAQDRTVAQNAVQTSTQTVTELVAQLQSLNNRIAELDTELGSLRESVNKALVDFHAAQSEADKAQATAADARTVLSNTQAAVKAAQAQVDEVARSQYRRGGESTAFQGAQTTSDALDRQSFLRSIAKEKRAAIAELELRRVDDANADSLARQAANQAAARKTIAEQRKVAAEAAIAGAKTRLSEQSAARDAAEAKRQVAEAQLHAARTAVNDLDAQQRAYDSFVAERKAREEAARTAAAEAARQAAAAAAANSAAQAAAAAVGAQQAEHTNTTGTGRTARPSTGIDTGNIADALNQLGTIIDTTQQQLDNPTTSPSPRTPGTGVTPGSPSTGGAATVTPGGETFPATTTPTTTAPRTSSGGTSAAGEIAISRALAVVGVPYAWGGGNASGPTQGIRDGGVADSFGDYNKVGFDCSGLTLYAFAGAGINLPHYSGYQYTQGTQVPAKDMQRGDLIFYGPGGNQHVAIYLGDGTMIESPQSGTTVMISPVRWGGMSPFVVRFP